MFRVDLKCISTVWHKMLNHNIPYNILNTKKIVFLLKTRLNIWFRINCSNHQKEANGGTWNIPSKYIHIRLKKTWVNFINQSVVQFIHISVYQSFCNYLSKVGMLSELHCIFNKILALAEKEPVVNSSGFKKSDDFRNNFRLPVTLQINGDFKIDPSPPLSP